MPSKVLETILAGKDLLSPVLTRAAANVEGFDAKVAAAQEKAATSAETSAKAQTTAADRVVAANARTATSSSDTAAMVTAANTRTAESAKVSSAKVVESNARAAESTRAFADVSESSAARSAVAWHSLATKALPLVAAAAVVVTGKMAGDYQQLVTKLETTAGESKANLAMVGQGMLDMAGQVGVSATELARGMYTVESGGYHGAAGLKVLKAAAQGAKQENADLEKVTDAVTTILHDYHLPASQAADVTSKLVTAVSHGKTTFDELTGSLHSVTPLASRLHVSLADVTGTLSAMTAAGMSSDQATQNMADTLRHLASPTSTMTNELAQLGITSGDLSDSLSQRGLSGTLQMIEEAIVRHVDPATRKVLLPALNQSKTAAQDLQIMLGQMPPSLAKLSRGLLDGSVSVAEYTKAAKSLGGPQAAMALQFLSLEKTSGGFNNVLKAGGPAAQAFTSAMAKSIGTASGLSVMLMTTGENAASTNAAVKDIGKSSGDVQGNIKGWAEVQGNLNQKLSEAGAEAKTLGIEAGQHLLPMLTNVVGWVGSTGLPGIERLGSGIGSLAHDFQELPGPVKLVAEVLGGLALANAVGIFSRIGREVTFARGLMQSFATMTRASMGTVSAAYNVAADSAARLAAIQGDTALMGMRSSLAGIGAAAGAAARGGLSAMGTGLKGLVGMLGGPWVVGIGAAVGAVMLIKHAIDQHNAAVKADTEQVTGWYKAIAGGGQGGIDAANNLKNKQNELAAAQSKLNDLQKAAPAIYAQAGRGAGGYAQVINIQKQKVADLTTETAKGKKAWDDYWNSLTPGGKLASQVAGAEADLELALQQHGAGSVAVKNATANYNAALERQKQLAGELTTAEQTQIDKLNQLANAQLGAVSSSLAADQAQSQLDDSIAQYNADAKDGQHSTKQLAAESKSLAAQAISAAQAAGKQAADQALANGITDDGTRANAAILNSLREQAKHITGPGHDALMKAIHDLEATTIAHGNVNDAAKKMGLTVVRTWDANTKEIKGATDAQIGDLEALGDKVTKLPNGNIVVTTDTGPAKTELDRLIAIYKNTTITVAGNYHVAGLNGGPGGTQLKATGGPIIGPGTGTSDSVPIMASHGEHMWTAAETAAAGGHAGVAALRKAVLAQRRGYAAGGPIGHFNMYDTMPAQLSAQAIREAEALIKRQAAAAAFAPGAPGNVSANADMARRMVSTLGWTGPEWNALYALGMRESGWRNTAQNPTSTAYGIPQFLNSTWATVGMSKTSDPGSQIIGMERYIEQRYGKPSAAWAHEMKFGWYQNGTPYVPNDGLAYLHRGERVVPAAQNFTAASAGGYSAPAMSRPAGPTQITVSFAGASITGRLQMGTDGFATLVDARIDQAFGQVHDLIHYAGN